MSLPRATFDMAKVGALMLALMFVIVLSAMWSKDQIDRWAYEIGQPVAGEFEVEVLRGDGSLVLRVDGRKLRQCEFVKVAVLVQRNGVWEKGHVEFVKDDDNTSRPIGKQRFGTWRVTPPDGEGIIATAQHNCGPRDPVVFTRLFEIKTKAG